MFWRWNSDYSYLETERGQHQSQRENVSQVLFARTFWGDYGGNTFTRFHYDYLLDVAPDILESINAMHGQGLVLKDQGYFGESADGQMKAVIEFFAYASDPDAYPVYDEMDYSDWESELSDKEMTSGWWADYNKRELSEAIERITDWQHDIVDDITDEQWWEVIGAATDIENESGYWESADSFILAFDADKAAEFILSQYAAQFVPAQETPLF